MIKKEELSNPNSCLNRARDDELVFVLLGRDPTTPAVIKYWMAERVRLGKNKWEDDQIREAAKVVRFLERKKRSGQT